MGKSLQVLGKGIMTEPWKVPGKKLGKQGDKDCRSKTREGTE